MQENRRQIWSNKALCSAVDSFERIGRKEKCEILTRERFGFGWLCDCLTVAKTCAQWREKGRFKLSSLPPSLQMLFWNRIHNVKDWTLSVAEKTEPKSSHKLRDEMGLKDVLIRSCSLHHARTAFSLLFMFYIQWYVALFWCVFNETGLNSTGKITWWNWITSDGVSSDIDVFVAALRIPSRRTMLMLM